MALTLERVGPFSTSQRLELVDSEGQPALFSIILGENNVGKTTLLRSIAAAWTGLSRPVEAWQLTRLSYLMDRKRSENDDAEIELEVAIDSTASKIEHVGVTKLEFSRDWGTRSGPELGLHARDLTAYGPYRRPMRESTNDGSEDDPCGTLFAEDARLRDAESWFLQADYNVRLPGPASTRYKRYLGHVRDLLIEVLPEVDDLRIIPPPDPGARWPTVQAHTPDGWVALRHLGAGYQAQIAWMVDFASRLLDLHPDSENPLHEPAVCLIDEIDLHMHPRWQREIVGLLRRRFSGTQFIATAHSPLIVQAAEDANLVLLRREGDRVMIDNDPERLRSWRVDQILTSELFGLESALPPSIDELVTERRKLLSKRKRTKADERRLGDLETAIGRLPAGESDLELRAMDVIRRAAAKLPPET